MEKPEDADLESETGLVREHGARFAKFSGVGVFNTITDLIVYGGLVAVGLSPALANIAGFFAANIQSYFLNARFTFGEKGVSAPVSIAGYGRFAAAHSVSLILSTTIVFFLAGPLGPLLAKLIAIALTVLVNYAFSAKFVFGANSADEDDGKA